MHQNASTLSECVVVFVVTRMQVMKCEDRWEGHQRTGQIIHSFQLTLQSVQGIRCQHNQ